ncbi:MAG: hypothetical protein U9Q18_04855 [Caldisericota bacterium]|nr:hypothetical protein [Caldisericota bacterium]
MKKFKLALCLLAIIFAITPTANAQEKNIEPKAAELEKMVVTATMTEKKDGGGSRLHRSYHITRDRRDGRTNRGRSIGSGHRSYGYRGDRKNKGAQYTWHRE